MQEKKCAISGCKKEGTHTYEWRMYTKKTPNGPWRRRRYCAEHYNSVDKQKQTQTNCEEGE